jgi:hypothetical protein
MALISFRESGQRETPRNYDRFREYPSPGQMRAGWLT